MRYLPLLAVTFLMVGCHADSGVYISRNKGQVIIDSAAQGKEFLPFNLVDNSAYYPIYYLGKRTDTLFLGHRPISMFSNEGLEKRYDSATNWNSISDLKIDVFVDTLVNVGHDIIYTHASEDNESEIIDSTKSIKAFAVFITNMSDSLVMMGSHNFVGYLTREVRDSDGNWIEIEHRLTDLCVTAKRSLILEPNDIMVAKLLRYQANAKTLCRLKLSMKLGNVEAYKTY